MKLQLGPLIGAASSSAANVWVALDSPGELTVRLTGPGGETHDAVGACSSQTLLTGNVTLRGLQEDTEYQVQILDSAGTPLGEGRFSTLPESPQKFAFAFASCHRPVAFADAPATFALWDKLGRSLEDRKFARFMLHVGDQIYADPVYDTAVERLHLDLENLLRARRDHFRGLIASWTQQYAALYATHWSPEAVRKVLGSIPNFMLWDDHDIADGWGSRVTSGWEDGQALFQAASTAYRFFQDSHNPSPGMFPLAFTPSPSTPICYGFGFTVGEVGFLAPDQRSFRQAYDPTANGETGNHPIFGDQQASDIARWLTSSAAQNLQVLFFVATVPFFHSSPQTIGLGTSIEQLDAVDNWISSPNRSDLAFILDQLFTWQAAKGGRRVVVLGGDVHMADAATITARGQAILQFVSSPITNKPSGGLLEDLLVAQGDKDFSVHGVNAHFKILRYLTARNFGRVTVDLSAAAPEITFEVHTEGSDAPAWTARSLAGAPWLSVG